MSALVADYGTSSSESDAESAGQPPDHEEAAGQPQDHEGAASSLMFSTVETDDATEASSSQATSAPPTSEQRAPLPSFLDARQKSTSVFDNPFRSAEDAQSAALERHVKLTEAPDKLHHINGVRVCWNYRKGRCRFGHKCTYAHDSDLQRTREARLQGDQTPANRALVDTRLPDHAPPHEQPAAEDNRPRKKRPGLGDSIKPGKKVMKMYQISKGQLT